MTSHRPRLGQHFLRDQNVVNTILAAAALKPSDTALEIGPGKGILTEPLSARVARLVAVELDRALAENLQRRFAAASHVQIIQDDFLKTNLNELFVNSIPHPHPLPSPPLQLGGSACASMAERERERPTAGRAAGEGWSDIKVLGNLPYSITSPIFEKLMPWEAWTIGVFLIQREVAARITARPGSRDFGILTLAVQLFAEAETILQVKPGAFLPSPKVSSSVIRLCRKTQFPLLPEEVSSFFDLAHGAFAHRRKTIANSLAFHVRIARSEIEKWLVRCGISPAARAETLALGDYVKLSKAWSIFRRERNLT